MKKAAGEKNTNQRGVSAKQLSIQALPEMWTFQFLANLIIVLPALFLKKMIGWTAGLGGNVITTANIKTFLFSWRLPCGDKLSRI